MKLKTFALLFTCNLIPPLIGMGLFPVLPLYAAEFGATSAMIGIYYSIVFMASMAGVMTAGWLGERVPRRNVFLVGATIGPVALALMSAATALWQVIALTALMWLSGALTITNVNVFVGRAADSRSRGRVFSRLFLAFPVAAVIGGTVAGHLLARYGYATTFLTLAAAWSTLPAIGLAGLRGPAYAARPTPRQADAAPAPFGRSFFLFMVGTLLAATAVNISRLGGPLSMQLHAFAPDQMASTATVSGLAAIPVAFAIGTLSDRFGHRRTLALGYTLAIAVAATLSVATELWQFWLAASLAFVAWCVNGSTAAALATSMLTPEQLGRGLPRIQSMDSVASIVGFAAAGLLMEALGPKSLYLVAGALALTALTVLGLASRATRPAQAPSPDATPGIIRFIATAIVGRLGL